MDPTHTLPRRIKVSELVAGDQLLLATGRDGKLFAPSEEFDDAVWAPLTPLDYVDQDGRGEPAAVSTAVGLLFRHPAETVIVRRELGNPEDGSTVHDRVDAVMALVQQFGRAKYNYGAALHTHKSVEVVTAYRTNGSELLIKIEQELTTLHGDK